MTDEITVYSFGEQGIAGPPGPVSASVVDPAALSAIDAVGLGLLIGTLAYVQSITAYFGYQPGSTATPNGSTIIAAMGGGNWILVTGSTPGSGNAIAFQGVGISPTPSPPGQGYVYVYDTGPAIFDLRQLTQDDILPGFAITGFSGGSTVEIGATVTNPAFTASYSSLPVSAQITNTASVDSPLTLTTPFTSGTVVGAFALGAAGSIGFTLTAIGGTAKTAGQSLVFNPRAFGGIGNAGATSATASGSTAILNGGAGTLASLGLFSSVTGQTFGPFSPSNQKILFFFAHTGSAHTFKDSGGFAFPFLAPTTSSFTNQNGSAVSYDLYESAFFQNGSVTLTVS